MPAFPPGDNARINPPRFSDNDLVVPKRTRGLPREIARVYLMVHVVVSMTGAYSFVESRWYGGNAFEFVGFFMLVVYFAADPKYWIRLLALVPYAAMVLLYLVLGLLSSPHAGELLKPALYTFSSLTLLTCAMPAVIADVVDLRRFVRAVQITSFICLGVCVAEGTIPRFAEFLAQSGPLDASEIRYHAFRTSGFLRNPNESANFYITTYLLSFWCSGPMRTVGLIVAVTGTYLSASRSGAVLLAVCLLGRSAGKIGYGVAKSRGRRAFLFIGPIFACLLVVGGISLLNPGLLSYRESGISRAGRILDTMESARERRIITDYWLPRALDAPVHGYGLRSFQGGRPVGLSSPAINDQGTHNTWLMLLGETGPLGPLAFFLVLWIAFFRIIRLREHPMDRLVLLLLWGAYLAFSVKAHTLFDYRYYTVVMCFLLYAPSLVGTEKDVVEPRTAPAPECA